MDHGESIAAVAVREAAEETGLAIELNGLAGIYTELRHVTTRRRRDPPRDIRRASTSASQAARSARTAQRPGPSVESARATSRGVKNKCTPSQKHLTSRSTPAFTQVTMVELRGFEPLTL
jgi:ADP-ribose pyrophosphatase YjhB (NUDIX family)